MVRNRLQGVAFGIGAVLVFSLIAWPMLSNRYPFAGGFFIMALMIVIGSTAAAIIETMTSGAWRGFATGFGAVAVSAVAIFSRQLIADPLNIVMTGMAALLAGGLGTLLALAALLVSRLFRRLRA